MEPAAKMPLTPPRSAGGSWFALHVKPRHERAIAQALRGRGFDEFVPLYRAKRRWSDRVKDLEVPLFPQYVFCQFSAQDGLRVLRTPGVRSIVGIGRRPAPVADSEIAALQTMVRSALGAHPWPFLETGQRVRIEAGPLGGLEGILVESRGACRLVVAVSLLQRSVAVEVNRLDVTPGSVPGRVCDGARQNFAGGWETARSAHC